MTEAGQAAPPHATVPDESAGVLARTYAQALVKAAEKDGPVDDVLGELAEVRDEVIGKIPALAALLASSTKSVADKDRVLARALEGRALPTTLRFLRVLNRHGRLELLGPVVDAARLFWDRRQNKRPVTVRSAVPLGDDQLSALRDRLAPVVGGTPVITTEVDPALIGGLVVQVGDDVYDASVRKRLETLRQRLIEGTPA